MNVAHGPASPSSAPASTPRSKIVLLYDDRASAVRGKALCEQLAEQLGVPCDLAGAMWHVDLMAVPETRYDAADAALDAEIVVLSLRGNEKLPGTIVSWCEDWMPRLRTHAVMLVALFDPATSMLLPVENTRAYLRKTASAAGIQFFGHASITASVPFLGEPAACAT